MGRCMVLLADQQNKQFLVDVNNFVVSQNKILNFENHPDMLIPNTDAKFSTASQSLKKTVTNINLLAPEFYI